MRTKKLRNSIPILGFLALGLLFSTLPAVPNLFACKSCFNANPYLPLLGAAYFTLLTSAFLLFPSFPSKQVAKGGLVWAFLLTLTLTYLGLPTLCWTCLTCHACNILIWIIWICSKNLEKNQKTSSFKERLCILLFTPIATVALFSSLNLSFVVYGFKMNSPSISTGLQAGELIPKSFLDANLQKASGLIINFTSPHCTFCKEQFPILKSIETKLQESSYRLINISSSPDFSLGEWIEDKEGKLQSLFKIKGYPTLFIVQSDGKIKEVFTGVSENLQDKILETISELTRE